MATVVLQGLQALARQTKGEGSGHGAASTRRGGLRSLRGMIRGAGVLAGNPDFTTAIYLLAALFAAMTVIVSKQWAGICDGLVGPLNTRHQRQP